MKIFLLSIYILAIGVCFSQSTSKLPLICKNWKLVGQKPFQKEYSSVDPQMAKIMQFNEDGSYQEEMFSLKSKGIWQFTADSTMLKIGLTEMNGMQLKGLSFEDSKPTNRILKLTTDSLIIGMEAYYGPEKIFGHDDWYFVPVP